MKTHIKFKLIGDTAFIELIGIFSYKVNSKASELFDFTEKLKKYCLSQKQKNQPIKVIVDMRCCHFISLTGAGCLMWAYTNLTKLGGEFEIINLHGVPLEVFRMSKLEHIIKCSFL